MDIKNLAQGCLVGCFVGDSAGARLEFLGRKPGDTELDDALAMKGGGVFRVAPGQITDDGELTLALARALVGEQTYPRDRVATNYRAWVASPPFDIGNATSSALGGKVRADVSIADAVSASAAKHNLASKANGALMRVSPLGIWSVRCTVEEAVAAARADAALTHPNLACQWTNAAYVVAIRHLLLNAGDVRGRSSKRRGHLMGARMKVRTKFAYGLTMRNKAFSLRASPWPALCGLRSRMPFIIYYARQLLCSRCGRYWRAVEIQTRMHASLEGWSGHMWDSPGFRSR